MTLTPAAPWIVLSRAVSIASRAYLPPSMSIKSHPQSRIAILTRPLRSRINTIAGSTCNGLAGMVDWSRFETVLSAEGRRAWWFEGFVRWLCDSWGASPSWNFSEVCYGGVTLEKIASVQVCGKAPDRLGPGNAPPLLPAATCFRYEARYWNGLRSKLLHHCYPPLDPRDERWASRSITHQTSRPQHTPGHRPLGVGVFRARPKPVDHPSSLSPERTSTSRRQEHPVARNIHSVAARPSSRRDNTQVVTQPGPPARNSRHASPAASAPNTKPVTRAQIRGEVLSHPATNPESQSQLSSSSSNRVKTAGRAPWASSAIIRLDIPGSKLRDNLARRPARTGQDRAGT
ncbi:hypothetical protein BKA56DRAFT_607741 [Ilyonectria sp. MPI-CAGE-AT-0026]|nr:hypothetical protein BKA56DRAFT_607741 [Ilyonectria sp. MPI-CAGE-AT-0026]